MVYFDSPTINPLRFVVITFAVVGSSQCRLVTQGALLFDSIHCTSSIDALLHVRVVVALCGRHHSDRLQNALIFIQPVASIQTRVYNFFPDLAS